MTPSQLQALTSFLYDVEEASSTYGCTIDDRFYVTVGGDEGTAYTVHVDRKQDHFFVGLP